jgi:hypothetical protein
MKLEIDCLGLTKLPSDSFKAQASRTSVQKFLYALHSLSFKRSPMTRCARLRTTFSTVASRGKLRDFLDTCCWVQVGMGLQQADCQPPFFLALHGNKQRFISINILELLALCQAVQLHEHRKYLRESLNNKRSTGTSYPEEVKAAMYM